MRPIVNKYREGKVKSTPMRGVKQTLKPNAYNQWEPALLRRAAPFSFVPSDAGRGLRPLGFRRISGGAQSLTDGLRPSGGAV